MGSYNRVEKENKPKHTVKGREGNKKNKAKQKNKKTALMGNQRRRPRRLLHFPSQLLLPCWSKLNYSKVLRKLWMSIFQKVIIEDQIRSRWRVMTG